MQIKSFEELLLSASDRSESEDSGEEIDRKAKIEEIKKMIEDETYLTHEKLDRALLNLLEEVEHE